MFRSLALGVSEARLHHHGHWNAVSYNGPDSVNLPISGPEQLYDMLFDIPTDLEAVARRAQLLDAVLEDAHDLRARLGARDRNRLDDHLDHLNEIQRRLELTGGACEAPAAPVDASDLHGRTDAMAELLAVALSCNLTRVFSFMLTAPGTNHVFSNLGVPDGMHKTCHDGRWDRVRDIQRYQMEAFARMLDKLAAIENPAGGTLLDRGLVFGTSEYGEGWLHEAREHPVVIAGRACGAIAPGMHVREPRGNLSKVHVTMLRALGIETPSYGFNGAETSEDFADLLA
jgi:hypothetical protein